MYLLYDVVVVSFNKLYMVVFKGVFTFLVCFIWNQNGNDTFGPVRLS